jgi:hypothetical protein
MRQPSKLRFSYATLRVAFHRLVSLPAIGSDVTEVLNPVSPIPTAGKLTTRVKPHTLLRSHILACLISLFGIGVFAAPALAETEGTGWEAFTQAYPTNLHPGATGTIQIDLINVGAKQSSGPITVTDTLPAGVSATAAGGMPNYAGASALSETKVASVKQEEEVLGGARWNCVGIGTKTVTCTSNPAYLNQLPIGYQLYERIGVEVSVEAGASQGTPENVVDITGGGATGRTVASDPVTLSSSEPAYGFSNWDVWFSNADGTLDTQAGSHPYETTFAVGYNEQASPRPGTAGGEIRNLEVELPPGFFGEPNSAPRCTRAQFDADECPPDTDIGQNAAMHFNEGAGGGGSLGAYVTDVYNMVAPPGVADEFATIVLGHEVFFDTTPRGYGDYRLVTRIDDIPEGVALDGNILTLWGVSSEASHTAARCTLVQQAYSCGFPSTAPPRPFLTLPTSCEGPQAFTINGLGTWVDEGLREHDSVFSHDALDIPAGFTGCSELSFDPSISTAPDTSNADTPAGLGVSVTFPQEALRVPGGLTESTDENTTVTLPEGLVINPGQAAGLQACTEAEAKLKEEGAPECPLASRVGTVKIQTPLLEGALESELTGDVYVLAQSNGGPGEPPNLQSETPTLQLLIAPEGDGVHLKLVANVQLNPATGQSTTTLTKTPGVPFTHFELAFSGGAQAALATPSTCGSYTTTSDFTPWASQFISDAFPSSSFLVTSGTHGTPCPSSPLPFSPSLIAGATTDQAGGFTNFSLLLQNGEDQQRIEKLQFRAPQGLSGMLSSVPLCEEPQAQDGTCSASSQIGHATVASGPGEHPLVIPQPGNPESQIYLTGPTLLEGPNQTVAPFGLSIVTHVIAGPFNLGTIVTRAKIEIDPHTAQITVTTDPLPQIIDGVPTDLRLVDSVIDRPRFMFNPTNCDPSSFSGTAWGTPPPGTLPGGTQSSGPGASAPIESHFQVGSCRSLEFKPKFTVSTSGKTSKSQGASLTAKIVYPSAPQGTQADIGYVKVDLPKQLPSRLTTLQKACTAQQFAANPAGCPAASVIGHAVVHTPVLPVPLEGPVYFVSNGGEAFPNLIMVLQGEGVEIELVGDTFISKAGITSSTFKTVPDQPFSSFELTLGEGPYSALAANGNLCDVTTTKTVSKKVTVRVHGHRRTVTRKVKHTVAAPLLMPTEFVGQNGAAIHQSTPIAVTGCPKSKPAKKAKKANAARKGGRKK